MGRPLEPKLLVLPVRSHRGNHGSDLFGGRDTTHDGADLRHLAMAGDDDGFSGASVYVVKPILVPQLAGLLSVGRSEVSPAFRIVGLAHEARIMLEGSRGMRHRRLKLGNPDEVDQFSARRLFQQETA